MFTKAKITAAILTIFIFGFTTVSFGDNASFQGLGFLSADLPVSSAYGVSADGSTVVGSSPDTAIRWQNGRITALSSSGSSANAVSANGSVIVGEVDFQAVRWQNGQMTGLGYLPGGEDSSPAFGVSADGSVIVGYAYTSIGPEAFRWSNGTMVGLGYLEGDNSSGAWGISADGSVVVGFSGPDSHMEACRWKNGQMTGLGDLPGGNFYSTALAASADGSKIFGYSYSTLGLEAFRWTEAGGMEGLGYVVYDYSYAHHVTLAVSADGSIIVGTTGGYAYIWDEQHGQRDLKDVLQNEYGLNLTGWTLGAATGISADGRTIVGMGIDPSGNDEGWIATLPEPVNPCTTPPDFELLVSPTVLWPPNHKMIKITPTWTVTDICDQSPKVLLVGITTNDKNSAKDDIQVMGNGDIYLRAEKDMTYIITYKACDESGNCSVKTAAVTVPHDNGKGK